MASEDLIQAVRNHAIQNYNSGGWDILTECWSDDDIAECIGNATTPAEAIETCGDALKAQADYRADIQGA